MNHKSHRVKKENLQAVIEDFIYDNLNDADYEIIEVPASSLLTWNRFDLGFKLFYLDLRNKNKEIATKVYKEDIRSQSIGSYIEPGNPDKNSFQKYIDDFEMLCLGVSKKGFNSKKSLIPLSKYDTIINGAHRVACAIHNNIDVKCVRLNQEVMNCDYKYFYERKVPVCILNMVTCKFIEYAHNIHIAFLWPSGKNRIKEVESKFKNIIYKSELKLTPKGAYNLLIELYKHMDWIGVQNKGYPGIRQKLIECFPNFSNLKIIVFQENDFEKVKLIKKEIRSINNIGFSSVHITDTKEEAVRISKLLFNENAIHFLNYSDPYKYKYIHDNINKFNDKLVQNKINNEDVVISGSAVLTLYGIRKNNDIDFLSYDSQYKKINEDNFNNHETELKFYEKDKSQIIYNPKFYFQYNGLKYISFNQLYKMKKNRNETKDKNDCKIMDALIENNILNITIVKCKQNIFYFKIKAINKLKIFIFTFLKFTGLYMPVRWIYYKIKYIFQ